MKSPIIFNILMISTIGASLNTFCTPRPIYTLKLGQILKSPSFLSITGTSPNTLHVLKLTLNYQIGATP